MTTLALRYRVVKHFPRFLLLNRYQTGYTRRSASKGQIADTVSKWQFLPSEF